MASGPVRVFCEARLQREFFDKVKADDVSDSVRDLKKAIAKKRGMELSDSRERADIVLQVLERGRRPAVVGYRQVRVRLVFAETRDPGQAPSGPTRGQSRGRGRGPVGDGSAPTPRVLQRRKAEDASRCLHRRSRTSSPSERKLVVSERRGVVDEGGIPQLDRRSASGYVRSS